MEYRPYYLSREWVRAGHSVRILAGAFSHLRVRQPGVVASGARHATAECIDGIEYVWFPTPEYQGNGLGRFLNIWAFLRQVWSEARRIADEFRPRVVIASSTYPMDIWVARRLARFAEAKLVFEVHDLWPLTLIEVAGMSATHPFVRLCQWAENAAYRDADVVVSMLPKVHGHMAGHGLDLRKLHIVPNGIATEEWQGSGEKPLGGTLADHIEALRLRGVLLVGYAGSHGVPNSLDTLLDSAALLKVRQIHFLLVGDGHEKARLLARVRNEGLSNVTMFPPIEKACIPAFLRSLDIAYIGWQNSPIYRFGIAPNKLMDYMMAGCAVLHAVSAGNDPVAESGCGLSVPPESPQAIAEGILKLSELSAAERSAMGKKGAAFVQNAHSYSVLARRFLDVLQE